MTDRDAQAKFRRDAVNTMTTHAKLVTMHLEKTKATVAQAAGLRDKLAEAIAAQTHNIGRLKCRIAQMVAESVAQRETVNNLIKPAMALVQQRES